MTPQTFIQRWRGADGSERANYQSIFNDLCELPEVDKPNPARACAKKSAKISPT